MKVPTFGQVYRIFKCYREIHDGYIMIIVITDPTDSKIIGNVLYHDRNKIFDTEDTFMNFIDEYYKNLGFHTDDCSELSQNFSDMPTYGKVDEDDSYFEMAYDLCSSKGYIREGFKKEDKNDNIILYSVTISPDSDYWTRDLWDVLGNSVEIVWIYNECTGQLLGAYSYICD